MYSLVKNYMFEATYWVIAVVYDKTSDLVTIVSFSSRDNIHKPEAQQTDIKDVQTSMKKIHLGDILVQEHLHQRKALLSNSPKIDHLAIAAWVVLRFQAE